MLIAFAYYTINFYSLTSIISPVPKIISDTFSKRVLASFYWKPQIKETLELPTSLKLTAESVISYDISEEKLIFGKNLHKKLPMASLTKIMTAIIALENMNLDDQIMVSKSAANVGENSMGLSEGEILSVKELLYGLMLMSGNDAAEAIAQGSKFGRAEFLYFMNKKVEDLGLSNTRFSNTTGLQGEGAQYTTVEDLLVITRYGLENEMFAQIVSTYEFSIPKSRLHKEYLLYNETNLLTSYPGVKGVKTGFTDEAGMCLVTFLDYKGHKIIAVILNSANRRQEMKDLLDYSLKKLGINPPIHI